jgi:DNA-directed RNA polymerase subunit RPC12/RpoP
MSGNNQQGPLKYYCMICGKEHREIACPYCGSKMKRVG